jgi:hypothetical protein
VQGEVASTRVDIAARVSGRLAKIPVVRGEDVAAGATLLVIDNPELERHVPDRQPDNGEEDGPGDRSTGVEPRPVPRRPGDGFGRGPVE